MASQFVDREEPSPVLRIGKVRIVRRNHVDPEEESIGQFREYFPYLFESRPRPESH